MEYTETEKFIRELYEIPEKQLTEERYREALNFDESVDMPDMEQHDYNDFTLEYMWEHYPKMIALELCTLLKAMRVENCMMRQELKEIDEFLPKTQPKTKMPECKPPKAE
jgi:hypothetical protein